jgi:hypothetical protein
MTSPFGVGGLVGPRTSLVVFFVRGLPAEGVDIAVQDVGADAGVRDPQCQSRRSLRYVRSIRYHGLART